MTGPDRRLVLQPRDVALLQILDTFRVIDRDQARLVGPFGSVTRANSRLLQLTQAGLLARLTVGTVRGGHRHLYARTRQGAAAVHQPYKPPPWNAHSPIVAGQPLLEHQLRLNQVYLAVRSAAPRADLILRAWTRCVTPPVAAFRELIPDASVELQRIDEDRIRAFFLEVDLATEPLKTWQHKAERYLTLARSGAFEATYHVPQFAVLVLVPSTRRLMTVRSTVLTVTPRLFFFATFDDLHDRLLTAPVWWRPAGDHPVTLLS